MNHDELLSRVVYDAETGKCYWKKNGRELGTLHSEGYLVVSFNNKQYKLHRLIWFYVHGVWPNIIDHIDHNKLNNCISNLRSVSRAENCRNLSKPRSNKSGFAGVCWHKTTKKFIAQIKFAGKMRHIGYYNDAVTAFLAREQVKKALGFSDMHGL